MENHIKIIYPSEVTERFLQERNDSGFLQMVRVELPDGKQYPVYFYDVRVLKMDLDRGIKNPEIKAKFISEPGLIVIPEITLECIESAVEQLYNQGYFDHLRPITGELFVDNNQNLAPRTKARYAFNSLLNDYFKSKEVSVTHVMLEGLNWLITLVNGNKILAMRNLYSTETSTKSRVSFETDYDPKRGGVIAHKSLPSSLSHGYDILIPNEQIAHVEKEGG